MMKMKPLTKCGGLVDKKEKLMFEIYKDKVIVNAEVLRKEIKKDYGFYPSSALFREITNYQINKYGCSLSAGVTGGSDYVPGFHRKNKKLRDSRIESSARHKKEQKLIERIEKRKRNASK